MRFESRELKPYAEYVKASDLKLGQVYFAVHFLDEQMLVPELHALVFIGRNLEPGETKTVYFQDYESHRAGVQYEPATPSEANQPEKAGLRPFTTSPEFHTTESGDSFVLTFENALNVLLRCSLERGMRPNQSSAV